MTSRNKILVIMGIMMLYVSITGYAGMQRKEAIIKKVNDTIIIIAHTTEEFIEIGSPICFLNEQGDTIIPYGKYRYGGSDTIKHMGFVLCEGYNKGWVAIDNKGNELFKPFIFDNGPDYVKESVFRIKDDTGLIGFADTLGNIVIKPQFAFAFPFKNGRAKVTFTGEKKKISNSDEYYWWDSIDWYYITKQGDIITE